LQLFRWLATHAVAAEYDLRRLGWRLLDGDLPPGQPAACPLLVCPDGLPLAVWLRLAGAAPAERRWMLMLGVDDGQARARLLRLGFGDVLGSAAALAEVEARTLRLIAQARTLPRERRIGALRLDLVGREAFVAGRGAGLHPREFALLWRLADQPGEAVSAADLLGDVWRLAFRPETNSLAVHVSRLRAKLRLAGLDGWIETLADGAYRLAAEPPVCAPALPLPASGEFALDAYLRLGKEEAGDRMQDGRGAKEKDSDHAA